MNAPKLIDKTRIGAVAAGATARVRWQTAEKQVIKALQFFDSAANGAGTGTAAVTVELYDRGTDGTGTTLLARVTNDTTTYPAETATTKAAAIPSNGAGIVKDLSSANAAVAAQGEGFRKLEGVNVAKNTVLEILITVGSTAVALVNATVNILYAPGQN